MPRNSSILVLFFFAVGLVACNSEGSSADSNDASESQELQSPQNTETASAERKAVAPPFEQLRIPLVAHGVDASKGEHIYLETGTEIIVPPNAFVDATGNPVEGKVDIKFREFHTAADLIIGGIIMQEPKTGRSMETAGMFEMRGEQNGQAISIAPGKELEVRLASFAEGEHFNDYVLDEEKAEWKLLSENIPLRENESRKNKLRELDKALPETPNKPKKRDIDAFVFDLDIDYSTFPELRSFDGVIWEYAGKGKNDPEKNPEVFKTNWKNIELKPSNQKGKYYLVLSSGDKSFKTMVQPVMTGKNYKAASKAFEKKMARYQNALTAQKMERERLANQAAFQRSMKVSNFGFRNCDIWSEPGRTKCLANFNVPESNEYVKDVNKVTFYLVEGSNRRVVTYHHHSKQRFSFDDNTPTALVAILPGDKVAVYSREKFESLPVEQFDPTKEENFDLEVHSAAIQTPGELDKLLRDALAAS